MKMISFPEATEVVAVVGTDEPIMAAARRMVVNGGEGDGAEIFLVCWQPNLAERERIAQGANVYIGLLGGVPLHFVATNAEGIEPSLKGGG